MIKIIGREVCIPQSEKIIGFENDNLVETRVFEISDKKLFSLFFKLDIKEAGCSIELEKSISQDGEAVNLLWNIRNGILSHGENLTVQIRAFNEDLSLVWHSESAVFFVGQSIGEGIEYTDEQLSEFSRIEADITAKNEQTKNYAYNASQSVELAIANADRAQGALSQAQEIADSMSFWDTFQENGMRENYQGMDGSPGNIKTNSFGGSTDKYIYPKYHLYPTMAYGMFHMCENLVIAPEVDFSQCTNMTAAFHTCTKLKKVGRVESYTVPNANYAFICCPELETIEYINLPSAQNFKGAFNESPKLKNIRFEKGSVRCSSGGQISFYFCPDLTPDSINSIFDGLGSVSGNPTIQFDKNGDNKAKYDAEFGIGAFQTKVDEANIKGWTVWPDENK